jgi:hypothetical protein
MFNNKKQLLCSNNLSLEIKKKHKKLHLEVVLYGSEIGTLGKEKRKGRKCIWNMELEKNVKNKLGR